MTTMTDGHMSQIIKLSREKGMTPERWTQVLASPVFAALLDQKADLSNPDAVLTALGLLVGRKARRIRTKVLAGLLELTGEPVKMSVAGIFIARNEFKITRTGKVPISYFGDNFKNNFLDVVEQNVPTCVLKQRKLLKRSLDVPILAALGDKDLEKIEKARTALVHVFDYLKTADRSKYYLFYVADAKGIVWAVRAVWGDDGWRVGADSVSNPGGWRAGHHVVSR